MVRVTPPGQAVHVEFDGKISNTFPDYAPQGYAKMRMARSTVRTDPAECRWFSTRTVVWGLTHLGSVFVNGARVAESHAVTLDPRFAEKIYPFRSAFRSCEVPCNSGSQSRGVREDRILLRFKRAIR